MAADLISILNRLTKLEDDLRECQTETESEPDMRDSFHRKMRDDGSCDEVSRRPQECDGSIKCSKPKSKHEQIRKRKAMAAPIAPIAPITPQGPLGPSESEGPQGPLGPSEWEGPQGLGLNVGPDKDDIHTGGRGNTFKCIDSLYVGHVVAGDTNFRHRPFGTHVGELTLHLASGRLYEWRDASWHIKHTYGLPYYFQCMEVQPDDCSRVWCVDGTFPAPTLEVACELIDGDQLLVGDSGDVWQLKGKCWHFGLNSRGPSGGPSGGPWDQHNGLGEPVANVDKVTHGPPQVVVPPRPHDDLASLQSLTFQGAWSDASTNLRALVTGEWVENYDENELTQTDTSTHADVRDNGNLLERLRARAAADQPLPEKSRENECTVCMERCRNSVLTCGHAFCGTCLVHLYAPTFNSVTCPRCREPTTTNVCPFFD